MFCNRELPALGRMVVCSQRVGHRSGTVPTPCSGRVLIHKSRGPTRAAAARWYRVTWGPDSPITLNHSPSICDELNACPETGCGCGDVDGGRRE